MKHLASLFCALALVACVEPAPDTQTGRIPQPGLGDLAATSGEFEERAAAIFLATHGEATEEVVFCCADEMCAEDEHCDFDGGFVCAPR